MCPPRPHKHTVLEMPTSQAPQSPSGPIPPPLHPKAHRRHCCPLLLLPPLTSHNLAQIFVYVCVSVCSLCWWLTKSPQESNLCVCSHWMRRLREPAGLGLLAEWCWLVDQAPLCLSPPPHPAPSSRPSLPLSLSLSLSLPALSPPPATPPPPVSSSSNLLFFQAPGGRSPNPFTSGQRRRDAWGGGGGQTKGQWERGAQRPLKILSAQPAPRGSRQAPALTWPPSLNLWGLAEPACPRPPKEAGRREGWLSPRPA